MVPECGGQLKKAFAKAGGQALSSWAGRRAAGSIDRSAAGLFLLRPRPRLPRRRGLRGFSPACSLAASASATVSAVSPAVRSLAGSVSATVPEDAGSLTADSAAEGSLTAFPAAGSRSFLSALGRGWRLRGLGACFSS